MLIYLSDGPDSARREGFFLMSGCVFGGGMEEALGFERRGRGEVRGDRWFRGVWGGRAPTLR